jgi:hypothetical protein
MGQKQEELQNCQAPREPYSTGELSFRHKKAARTEILQLNFKDTGEWSEPRRTAELSGFQNTFGQIIHRNFQGIR